jgi:hypothetical protein
MSESFQFGNPKVNEHGFSCCGKPRGCTMTHEGCAYLSHPWKRAMVFGDTTVQCQATGVDPESGEQTQCSLLNGHDGAHT